MLLRVRTAIGAIATRTADRTTLVAWRSIGLCAAVFVAACSDEDAADEPREPNGSAARGGTGALSGGASGTRGGATGGTSGFGGQSGTTGGSGATSGTGGTGGGAASDAGATGGTTGTSGSGGAGVGGAAGGAGASGVGGTAGAAGVAGTGGTAGAGNDPYPCNGTTTGYEAVVTGSGTTWTARRGATSVYTGSSMADAMQAALNGLTAGRTTKERVLVQGSGSIPNNRRVELASNTVLNVCGTIDVTNAGGAGDMAPIYARNRTNIEIPHANITGVPLYGMFFRDVDNLQLGRIDLRLSNVGLGIRIDNHGRADRSNKVRNIRIDAVRAEGTGTHGVETYGVDGLQIGSVVAVNTTDAGLLLNDTVNATVGTVDGDNAAGVGTGYAAFRIANVAGRIGTSWPAGNIHVGQVIARRGGRGIFCVSDSGGLTVDRITVENTGNNAILLENCHNTRIAAVEGRVSGSPEIRISHRTNEHTPSSDIVIQNLTVTGTTIRESPCGTNIAVCNISGSPPINVCPGTLRSTCP